MNPILQSAITKPQDSVKSETSEQESSATGTPLDALYDKRLDPAWIPNPKERHQLMQEHLRAEIRKYVRFDEVPENVFWDRFFIDEETNTVAIRTEFRDGPGAVEFKFNDRAELISVSGRGVKELHFVKDLEVDPSFDPFAPPSPFTPPKPF